VGPLDPRSGPWLSRRRDPGSEQADLRTIVNGEKLQETTTDLMIFPIPKLIATISDGPRSSGPT